MKRLLNWPYSAEIRLRSLDRRDGTTSQFEIQLIRQTFPQSGIEGLIAVLGKDGELGQLRSDHDEDSDKTWHKKQPGISPALSLYLKKRTNISACRGDVKTTLRLF
jgi:hypothetical protein